ncbi:MAG: transcription elongation factor GreA [Firmicutes bacterium]|nr:transcription elongation factor GreA [Bacillota bacterium]
MSGKEVLLTPEGLKKLEKELEILKTVKRRQVAERIREALDFGDISENSEYDDAKNEQAFIEGRIITLEKTLRNAKLISDEDLEEGIAAVGRYVTLRDLETNEVFQYQIVGSAEANPMEAKISNESPVGQAVLGKKPGTIVDVEVADGILQYELLEVSSEASRESF